MFIALRCVVIPGRPRILISTAPRRQDDILRLPIREKPRAPSDQCLIFAASSLSSFSRFSLLEFHSSSSSSCILAAVSLIPISLTRFCRSILSSLRTTPRPSLPQSRRTLDRAFLTARRVSGALSIRRSVIELTATLEICLLMLAPMGQKNWSRFVMFRTEPLADSVVPQQSSRRLYGRLLLCRYTWISMCSSMYICVCVVVCK